MSGLSNIARAGLLTAATILVLINAAAARAQQFFPEIIISSTIPANGDLNPYGVAFVPPGFPSGGPLEPGDILVSNFNNSGNLQGMGSTIIKLRPNRLVTRRCRRACRVTQLRSFSRRRDHQRWA
jgi:hypothetical protein